MTAQLLDISTDEYHKHPAISVSQLKVFAESPLLYWRRFIEEDPLAQQEETEAMKLGTLLHRIILETPQEDWFREWRWPGVKIIPPEVLSKSGSRAGDAWKKFEAENPKLWLIKQEETTPILRMINSVADSCQAMALLGLLTHIERPILWDHHGFEMRGKPDGISSGNWIVDLKTTRDASEDAISAQTERLLYHWQDVAYSTAWRELTGETLPFYFIFIETTVPWRVVCRKLPQEWRDRASVDLAKALEEHRQRQMTGSWLDDGMTELKELQPPKWAPKLSGVDRWQLQLNEGLRQTTGIEQQQQNAAMYATAML